MGEVLAAASHASLGGDYCGRRARIFTAKGTQWGRRKPCGTAVLVFDLASQPWERPGAGANGCDVVVKGALDISCRGILAG